MFVLEEALKYPYWHYVELNTLEAILDWLILSTDPIKCFKSSSKAEPIDVAIFR